MGKASSGGEEQSYYRTMRQMLDKCGISGESWYTEAMSGELEWKKLIDEKYRECFLEKWHDREEERKISREQSRQKE